MSRVSDIETPAVTILVDRLEKNIRRVQDRVAGEGRANRPHIKTHKIPAIGKMQMDAGAIGLTCQKLGEAEVFIDSGICGDIFLTFNIISKPKTDRLMELAGRVKRLAVVADNETVLDGLSKAGVNHGRDVRFLVECDTGFGRNGVQSPEAALELAKLSTRLPRLAFEGLAVFPNTAPRTREFLTRAVEIFAKEDIPISVLSGGGSPALSSLAEYPMMTEHRAGTYVYNDVMMVHSGIATWDDCAMHVRATVVSRPTEDRAVIDAGSKVLTSDQYYVKDHGRIVEYPDAIVSALSEEHGIVDLSKSPKRPKVGEVVSLIPNHCCVVSNMVDEVYAVRDGVVETVWKVAARGKVR